MWGTERPWCELSALHFWRLHPKSIMYSQMFLPKKSDRNEDTEKEYKDIIVKKNTQSESLEIIIYYNQKALSCKERG